MHIINKTIAVSSTSITQIESTNTRGPDPITTTSPSISETPSKRTLAIVLFNDPPIQEGKYMDGMFDESPKDEIRKYFVIMQSVNDLTQVNPRY